MRYILMAIAAIHAIFFLPVQADASTQKRLALLIGNQDYTEEVGPLDNPHNDIMVLEKALKTVGFSVTIIENAGYAKMDIAARIFAKKLGRAGENAVGFFYYSGHGAVNPDPMDRRNYLIPVDVKNAEDTSFWDKSLPLTRITNYLKTFASNATRFVVIDACRNELILKPKSKGFSSNKGLKAFPYIPSILLAYSTEPLMTASDSSGYSVALADELVKPGLKALDVFTNVQTRISQETGQQPYLNVPPLPDLLCFASCESGAEVKLWAVVRVSKDVRVIQVFKDLYPTSTHFPEMQKRISFLNNHPNIRTERSVSLSDAPIHQCDRMAGNQYDPDHRGDGIEFWDIVEKKAVLACQKAVKEYPQVARFEFQLGRAFHHDRLNDKARFWYLKAMESGSIQAAHNIGVIYNNAEGVKRDYKKAYNYYSRAAKREHAPSITAIGWMYYKGQHLETDYLEALVWYKRALKTGFRNAMKNIGLMYHNGHGVKQDYSEARKWYLRARSKADPRSMNQLGWMYYKGQGTRPDYKKARKYFEEAVARDEQNAMRNLGRMAEDYRVGEPDYAKAKKWYLEAQEIGDATAMSALGWMNYLGRGGDVDCVTALKWYNKSIELDARQGNAMNNKGLLYYKGKCKNIKKNYKTAMLWFEKAAKLENKYSLRHLGSMYSKGEGVAKNFKAALVFFERAAKLGDSSAMESIGKIYFHGHGVEKNFYQAARWWIKADEKGSWGANWLLAKMYEHTPEMMDSVHAASHLMKAATRGHDKARTLLLEDRMKSWKPETREEVQVWLRDKVGLNTNGVDGSFGPATMRALNQLLK